MALTADNHVIDPNTGFALDKDTGHPIGLVAPPVARVSHENDWPKWVTPHGSHIVRKKAEGAPDAISVLGEFSEFHVNRIDGSVTVLVKDEDEEKLALAEVGSTAEPLAELDPEPPAPVDEY